MVHRKILPVLILILAAGLTIIACQNAAEPDADVAPVPTFDFEVYPGELLRRRGLIETEFSLFFSAYNVSGKTLYYSEGFRLYCETDEQREIEILFESDAIGSIAPGALWERYIQWSDIFHETGQEIRRIPGGIYRFFTQIFTDPNNRDDYEYFQTRLVVIPIERHSTRGISGNYFMQERVDIVARRYPSEVIVPIDYVRANQTGMRFTLENTSDREYMYGLGWSLAYYDNGRWRPVPYIGDRHIIDIGLILHGGETTQYAIEWEQFHGRLPAGRYMFFNRYIPDGFRYPLPDDVIEYVMIEFTLG